MVLTVVRPTLASTKTLAETNIREVFECEGAVLMRVYDPLNSKEKLLVLDGRFASGEEGDILTIHESDRSKPVRLLNARLLLGPVEPVGGQVGFVHPSGLTHAEEVLARDHLVEVVKSLRERSGMGLKDAHQLVKDYRASINLVSDGKLGTMPAPVSSKAEPDTPPRPSGW